MHLNQGHITIGCSPFRSTYLLAKFIPYFQKKYPAITLELCEDTTLRLEELALNGETDISISLLPINKKNFSYEELFKERLLLAIPPYHPICREYNLSPGIFSKPPIINLSKLKNTPFILMEQGQKLHCTLLELCRQAGFSPQIKLETQSMDAAQALAGAGIGVTLLPHTLIQSVQPKLAPCYTSLIEKPSRIAIVIWRKNRYLSRAAQKFICLLKNFCAQSTKEKESST
ncbi:LysR family transcriptional regulator substrate-binding protein [Pectinatus haikarae]|uniref:DNA-binding transcriptional LysR family regulator n=2 Tax=Pectinatus haikarae TaxID=349096 RepID=A0ABT9YB51_9FIRM|nr:LysR family transcriptional regulator substrate-binding protein [Pectinatus haikarae]MDQ0205069.1 DNA-binding transcriptional LysR family regulator [Pectinatus haikarae]